MTTMVDKVATALADSLDDGLNWQDYREQAVTAIEAMKDPTNEMLNAGWGTISTHVIDGRPEEIWPAMIDAALKEEEQ